MEIEKLILEGRNAVAEALRAGKTIDKAYVQEGNLEGSIRTLVKNLKDEGCFIQYVSKERLDQMSETGKHQGIIAHGAVYPYAGLEDILALAEKKKEPPFLVLLDGIEDPHNLGAIIRTVNQAGAHGVVILKNRAVGLTPVVARTSAGALAYTPVVRVTNMVQTMKTLKEKGIWFVGGDMGGSPMYQLNLKGPMGLVIGSEGAGLSRLVRENCDMLASIPMRGDIDSLNASVAAGILAYEIVRQRML